MQDKQTIRLLDPAELQAGLDLVWKVFTDFLAPTVSDAAIEEMWAMLDWEYFNHRTGDGDVRLWGAFLGDDLIGVCAIERLCHVAFLAVLGDCQDHGVGRTLLTRAVQDCKALDPELTHMTVLAPLPVVDFFAKTGFVPVGAPEVQEALPLQAMRLDANQE